MSIKRKIRLMTVFAGILAGAAIGCGGGSPLGGGATNNDQGTSFLAFGYFPDTESTAGVTGVNTFLSNDSNTGTDDDGGNALQGAGGREIIITMGIQNRLRSQFIRVARIDCDYTVPGADPSFSVPSDSFNGGGVIAAAGPSTTPGGPQAGSGSILKSSFTVLSTDIYSYLNVNRNYLPELPFRMLATCRAVGITQAGDVLVTNDLPFQIIFLDQAECCTGEDGENPGVLGGFQTGPGVGGTPLGGTSDEDEATTPTPTPSETPTPTV